MNTKHLRPTVLLMACLLIFGLAARPAAAKDKLVWAVGSKIPTMDIYGTTSLNLTNIYYMVSDALLDRDLDTLELKPNLVTEWERLDDTTWEFTLRKGVTFHNGNPLTAEDIRYTIMDRILNPELKSRQAPGFKFIKEVKVLDKHTFQIITKGPYPLTDDRLNTFFPYDKEWCESVGEETIAEKPMGTGPYTFVQWDRGSRVVLTANPEYWNAELPKIKDVVVRIIPEQSTRIAELLNGGVDLISKLDPDKCAMVEKNAGTKVLETPSHRITFWQFDSMGRAGETPFTDKRVRQAVCHAIDREKIIEVMFQGHSKLLNTCLSPFDFGYNPDMTWYEYDPDKAKALLAEAGYPDGFEADILFYYPISKQFNEAAMGYLKKVGITLNFKNYVGNVGQAIKVRDGGKCKDIGNFGWASYMLLDADGLLPFWFGTGSKKNYSGDEKLGAWIEEARYSFDQDKRKKLYYQVQDRVKEQVYWMPVNVINSIYGANEDLTLTLPVNETLMLKIAEFK